MAENAGGGQEQPKPAAGGSAASASGAAQGGQTGSGENTAAENQPASGGKAGALSEQPKAPDRYELRIPEGAETVVDAGDLADLAAQAKAHGWTNEEAQEALTAQANLVISKLNKFRADTEADKEYGGANLVESQRLANRVIDRVRPTTHPRAAEFRRILTKTALINHIEVLSFLADLGKLMREDQPPQAGPGAGGEKKSQAAILYPGQA